ncbi:hypothetical protein Pelo_5855 [Pelomyxa schiedti]|nr:hypothetical protein Pelo_5855 [Pelomyxa schiedti]
MTFHTVLDARSQFVALACGALVSSSRSLHYYHHYGASPMLASAAIKVLLEDCQIGQKWVATCGRHVGFDVWGKHFLPGGDYSVVVFVGLSHTLGVVWHRVHVFGGIFSDSTRTCAHYVAVGCYLGCGNWIAEFTERLDSESAHVSPFFVMNEDSGRLGRRIPGELLDFKTDIIRATDFESNRKWLVCLAPLFSHPKHPCLGLWRLVDGVPVDHCVLEVTFNLIKVRFQTCSYNVDEVTVVASILSQWHVLFVDLEASFFSGKLVITREKIVSPPSLLMEHMPLKMDDAMQLQPNEFLTSHSPAIPCSLKDWKRVLYNTLTDESVVFQGSSHAGAELLPPSYVVAKREYTVKPRCGHYHFDLYSASALRLPQRVHEGRSLSISLLPSFELLVARGRQTHEYQDLVTGQNTPKTRKVCQTTTTITPLAHFESVVCTVTIKPITRSVHWNYQRDLMKGMPVTWHNHTNGIHWDV